MKNPASQTQTFRALPAIAAAMFSVMGGSQAAAAEFSRATIDLGCVVSDLDQAVKFYTDVIGFKQSGEFTVTPKFAKDAGLTDGKELKVKVMTLGKGDTATKFKLMQIADPKSKKSDNAFIHSQLGFSYLTIFVADIAAAHERIKKAGAKLRGKTPIQLGQARDEASQLYFILVADPDGNLIELIGPKK